MHQTKEIEYSCEHGKFGGLCHECKDARIASLEAENERLRTASIALLKWFSEELPAWQPETVVRYLIKGNMEPVAKLRAALKGRG